MVKVSNQIALSGFVNQSISTSAPFKLPLFRPIHQPSAILSGFLDVHRGDLLNGNRYCSLTEPHVGVHC